MSQIVTAKKASISNEIIAIVAARRITLRTDLLRKAFRRTILSSSFLFIVNTSFYIVRIHFTDCLYPCYDADC